MNKSNTVLFAVGGGNLSKSEDILREFTGLLKDQPEPRVTVMTVATDSPDEAGKKYDALFRRLGIGHVSLLDINERAESFAEKNLEKVCEADALFFTGGDQLHVTSLIGGTPLHTLIHERVEEGFIVAGSSAGAMMMSNAMIVSGGGDAQPRVGGVEIAPGMDLLSSTIIDAHFTERGRHGRLMTAVTHYPQNLGIGIDECTAICVEGNEFKVLGMGVVTIIDGSRMNHSNLPYCRKGEMLGMVGLQIHVLPAGYKYDLEKREPLIPAFQEAASAQKKV